MILLRPDCLVFKQLDGSCAPASVPEITFELVGQAAQWVDRELIEHAAQAVLHYFKVEKCQTIVSVDDFWTALERVLRGLGLEIQRSAPTPAPPTPPPIPEPNPTAPDHTSRAAMVEADLLELAAADGHGCELMFYPRLRTMV